MSEASEFWGMVVEERARLQALERARRPTSLGEWIDREIEKAKNTRFEAIKKGDRKAADYLLGRIDALNEVKAKMMGVRG